MKVKILRIGGVFFLLQDFLIFLTHENVSEAKNILVSLFLI